MILLFDAGGVLIELGPPPLDVSWLAPGTTMDQVWSAWMKLDVFGKFESGQITEQDFAREMIDSLNFQTSSDVFLERFRAWPVAPFPGTVEWLEGLSANYDMAMLSNTNELHWRRMKDEMGLGDVLDHYFLSHKLGMVKPDRQIFSKVLSLLNAEPEEVVFFDDNLANTAAANEMGIKALHVAGPDQLRAAVAAL